MLLSVILAIIFILIDNETEQTQFLIISFYYFMLKL